MTRPKWNKETNRPRGWKQTAKKAAAISLTRREDDTEPAIITFRKLVEAGANAIVEPAKAEGRRELIEWLDVQTSNTRVMGGRVIGKKLWQQLLKEIGE